MLEIPYKKGLETIIIHYRMYKNKKVRLIALICFLAAFLLGYKISYIIINNISNNYILKDLIFYFLFTIISTILLLLFILRLDQILGLNLHYKVKINNNILIISPYISSKLENITLTINNEGNLEIEDNKTNNKIVLISLQFYDKFEIKKIFDYLIKSNYLKTN